MKTELEEQDIEAIAQRVVELLKPLLLSDNSHTEDRLLTVKELSKYTGLSKQWIYNNKKKLEPQYLNGKPLFRLSTINAMLKSQRNNDSALCNTPALKVRDFNKQKN